MFELAAFVIRGHESEALQLYLKEQSRGAQRAA
jgi:hypothetical protein